MQALLLDELNPEQIKHLQNWLAEHTRPAALPGTYWLELPVFSPQQEQHIDTCGPFRLAVVLSENALRLELLVRAMQSLHCTCIAMADARQRSFALDFWDNMLLKVD